jgi:3-oxoacyl-[acyl-carrier protein] reductase
MNSPEKLAVITGVSRGIGRATALTLAKRGVRLALLGRPSADHDNTVRQCSEHVPTRSFECDLANRGEIEAAAARIEDELGSPDIVIHNAAILERGRKVHELDPDDWDRLLAVNLRGPFLLTRALLPGMLTQNRGRLLFISSVSGTIGCPEMAHYGVSKWGLIGLAKSLSEEFRGTELMALSIQPGSVDTAMLEKTPFPPDMSPDDVAQVIAFYALDAPACVAGASVEVYG